MTLRRQLWLLTLATYVMLALTAVVVALANVRDAGAWRPILAR